MSFMSKLGSSIFSSDWYILLFAVFAVAALVVVLLANRRVSGEFERWKKEIYYSVLIYRVLTIGYTLFVTLISIFPILGMLGTVTALLGLDLSGEAASVSARTGFFNALTSTAWGIIFAVIFKIINAVISPAVENNIQLVTDLINQNRDRIRRKKGKLSDLIRR